MEMEIALILGFLLKNWEIIVLLIFLSIIWSRFDNLKHLDEIRKELTAIRELLSGPEGHHAAANKIEKFEK